MKPFHVKRDGWTAESIAYLREHWPDLSITTDALGRALGCSATAVRTKRTRPGLPARPSPIVRRGDEAGGNLQAPAPG